MAFKQKLRSLVINALFYTPFGGKSGLIRRWLQFVNPVPGDKLLDICCGNGAITALMDQAAGPSGLVVGIDADHLVFSNGNAPPGICLAVADGSRLPFTAAVFDKITISLGLHHMKAAQRRSSLGETRRLLKPEGRLYVMEHNLPSGFWPGLQARCQSRLDTSREAYPMLINRTCLPELAAAGYKICRRELLGNGTLQFIEAI